MRVWLIRLVIALGLVAVAAMCPPRSASAAPALDPVGPILDKLCPPRDAPYPQSPEEAVIARGGGPGDYAAYGYAGLQWSTWDAGCGKAMWDTSAGTAIDSVAITVDGFANELQIAATRPETTDTFDIVVARAVQGLRDAFWSPWVAPGLAMFGVILVWRLIAGREGEAWASAAAAALVIVGVTFLIANPGAPGRWSNAATAEVTSGVSETLLAATPTGAMPESAQPWQKYSEAYHGIAVKSWVDGWACGDKDAVTRYGTRLRAAQAFSVADVQTLAKDGAARDRMVKEKNAAWTRIGEQMEKTNPVAFGCWKGEGKSRTSAGLRHLMVSLGAGVPIMLASVAQLAMRWVLRLALLFIPTFGAVMIFSERFRDQFTELLLMGLIAPPVLAAGIGALLWGYYAILLHPDQSWWMAGVSCLALGVALWFAKGVLVKLFVGLGQAERGARSVRRRGGRAWRSYQHAGSHGGHGGAVAAGTVAGTTAAVVDRVVTSGNSDDDAASPDNGYDGSPGPRSPGRGPSPHDGSPDDDDGFLWRDTRDDDTAPTPQSSRDRDEPGAPSRFARPGVDGTDDPSLLPAHTNSVDDTDDPLGGGVDGAAAQALERARVMSGAAVDMDAAGFDDAAVQALVRARARWGPSTFADSMDDARDDDE